MTANHLIPPLYEAPVSDWIRLHLERSAGLHHTTLDEITEGATAARSVQVDALRNARLRMGHLRYGALGWAPRDRVECVRSCLLKYESSKNTEFLVDAINWAELEFIHPSFEGTYFKAVDR
jgi:hypothetical protein